MSLAEDITPSYTQETDPPLPRVDWSLTRIRDRALDGPIASCVNNRDRVLDLGCGQGDLLLKLREEKDVLEQGIEIDGSAVTEAISRGLSVVHGDLEKGLADLGDQTFDIVILNQVITVIRNPVKILKESLRVGRKTAVTLPNFAFHRTRFQLALTGRLPVNPSLPYQWHDTPNIRYVTVRDFRELCYRMGFKVHKEVFVSFRMNGQVHPVKAWPNMRASSALFLLSL